MNDTEYKIKSYNTCSLWKPVYAHMIRYVCFFVYLSDLHSMKQIFVSLHAKNYVWVFFKKIRIFLIDVVLYMCAKINKFVFILYFLSRIVGVFYNWIFMLRSGLSISLLVHSESGYVFWECVVKSTTVNHRFLEISALWGG